MTPSSLGVLCGVRSLIVPRPGARRCRTSFVCARRRLLERREPLRRCGRARRRMRRGRALRSRPAFGSCIPHERRAPRNTTEPAVRIAACFRLLRSRRMLHRRGRVRRSGRSRRARCRRRPDVRARAASPMTTSRVASPSAARRTCTAGERRTALAIVRTIGKFRDVDRNDARRGVRRRRSPRARARRRHWRARRARAASTPMRMRRATGGNVRRYTAAGIRKCDGDDDSEQRDAARIRHGERPEHVQGRNPDDEPQRERGRDREHEVHPGAVPPDERKCQDGERGPTGEEDGNEGAAPAQSGRPAARARRGREHCDHRQRRHGVDAADGPIEPAVGEGRRQGNRRDDDADRRRARPHPRRGGCGGDACCLQHDQYGVHARDVVAERDPPRGDRGEDVSGVREFARRALSSTRWPAEAHAAEYQASEMTASPAITAVARQRGKRSRKLKREPRFSMSSPSRWPVPRSGPPRVRRHESTCAT